MEEHGAAGAGFADGDERRAVGKARPGAFGQIRRRFGQHLPLDQHAVRPRHAGKGAEFRKIGERLGLGPGQGAAKLAFALAQDDRDERIADRCCGEARTGKTDQRAALCDPRLERFVDRLRQAADVGQHDGRGLLRQDLRHRDGEIGDAGLDQVGIGRQRPLDIVERRQEWLEIVADIAGNEGYTAAAETVVQQVRRPSRGKAGDRQAGKVVAQFEGGRDLAAGHGCAGGEVDIA